MNKGYACFVLFLVLTLFVVPCIAMELDKVIQNNVPFQYALSEDRIWIRNQDIISQFSLAGNLIDEQNCKNVEHMAEKDGILYLHLITDNSSVIQMLSADLTVINTWVLPNNIEVRQFEISNDYIIISSYDKEAHDSEQDHSHGYLLHALNKFTGNLNTIKLENRDESLFTAFTVAEDKLFAIEALYGELVTINLVDESTAACDFALPVGYLSYDANSNTLYGLLADQQGSSIIKVNPKTGEYGTVCILNGEIVYAGLRGNDSGLYVEDVTRGSLCVLSKDRYSGGQDAIKLSIINSVESLQEPRMLKALELLKKDYPDVELSFKDVGDTRVLATMLMSGDSSVDIIAVQEYGGICSKAMFKSGALYDLNNFAQINEVMDEWVNLDGIFTMDGKRFGLPQTVNPYFWQVNVPLFEKLGLTIPNDNWNWDDFFALCESVSNINKELGTQYTALADEFFPYILTQYNMNNIDFASSTAKYNGEEFIRIMGLWKMAYDNGVLLLDPEAYFYETLVDTTLFQITFGEYCNLMNNDLILPPKIMDSTRYPTLTTTLVLNRSSANHEIAARFLAYYMSPEAVLMNNPTFFGHLLKEDYYGDVADDAREKYWYELLKSGVQEYFFSGIIGIQMNELYPQFMSGKITAEQFAFAMQEKADMALGE